MGDRLSCTTRGESGLGGVGIRGIENGGDLGRIYKRITTVGMVGMQ